MKNRLVIILAIFVIFDAGLAIVLFNPSIKISPLLKLLPRNCKVVDASYCKSVQILGDEKLNETIVAVFKLPKGSKVYSPVGGTLEFQRLSPGNIPYHYLNANDGSRYYFIFEPESPPAKKQVSSGDVIGVVTGTPINAIKDHTLGIIISKNMRFDREVFYSLFSK